MRFAFKTYEREERDFPDLACHPVSVRGARAFARHVERAFSESNLIGSIRFSKTCNGPAHASWIETWLWKQTPSPITLDPCASWLTLAHEIAHALEWRINRNGRHDRRFHRRVAEVARIAERDAWHIRDVIASANVGEDL